MSLFANPIALLLLPIVLSLLILIFWRSRKEATRRLDTLVAPKLLARLTPQRSAKKEWIKFSLFFGSIVFFILGLSGPQWGSEKRKVTPRGIDVLIAVDVSKSMLAQDIRPNRLERAKLTLNNSLEKVRGDRLGLIAFSGSAFLYSPLTLDHQAFSKTLNSLKIGLLPREGTDLSAPIKTASSSFSKDDTDKFLILLSDGEDLEGKGVKQAKVAAREGIKIFTIGIGSEEGARIPDPPGQARNFKKNSQGEDIITQLNERILTNIAQTTGGQYYKLGPTGEGLTYVFEKLQSIGQQKSREQFSTELPIDRYQVFVILGLLFLLSDTLYSSTKKVLLSSANSCIVLLLLMFPLCLQADNVKRAEEAFAAGKPDQAAIFYQAEIDLARQNEKEPDPRLILNGGLVHFEAGDFGKAEPLLEEVLDYSDQIEIHPIALNTLGNIHYRKANLALDGQNVSAARKSWNQALYFYKEAVRFDDNAKAKINLESLQTQIEQRIESLVTKLYGKVWRDINKDGIPQDNEPCIPADIFWDKNDDGEFNSTTEPSVPTDDSGNFAFEWISGNYPTELRLGSILHDRNQSDGAVLRPRFPPPPPPQNPESVKNYYINIPQPGELGIPMPYWAAPQIRGRVWHDQDGDGLEGPDEKGFSSATLFLDLNGNFQLDENETFFKPAENGSFSQIAPPDQYSVCIQPDNPEANVTYPLEEAKAHLASIDYEKPSELLLFGVQDSGSGEGSDSQDQQSSQSEQADASQSDSDDDQDQTDGQFATKEDNALFERLQQETESRSQPLPQDFPNIETHTTGRDW